MKEQIFVKHEMRDVFNVLDALQTRADNLIYSRESPSDDSFKTERSNEQIEKLFGVPGLDNSTVDKLLKELQVNYVALAKEVLSK